MHYSILIFQSKGILNELYALNNIHKGPFGRRCPSWCPTNCPLMPRHPVFGRNAKSKGISPVIALKRAWVMSRICPYKKRDITHAPSEVPWVRWCPFCPLGCVFFHTPGFKKHDAIPDSASTVHHNALMLSRRVIKLQYHSRHRFFYPDWSPSL